MKFDQLLREIKPFVLRWIEGAASSVEIISGMIVVWNGTTSNVPAGWLACDGTNGTPDLNGAVTGPPIFIMRA